MLRGFVFVAGGTYAGAEGLFVALACVGVGAGLWLWAHHARRQGNKLNRGRVPNCCYPALPAAAAEDQQGDPEESANLLGGDADGLDEAYAEEGGEYDDDAYADAYADDKYL